MNSDKGATEIRSADAAAGGRSGPQIGTQIGSYRIDAWLDEGGMGVVYRATDLKLNRPVAIKFLADNLLDANARRRFQREAQMASGLNHPHILSVYDVGEHEGRQYLVTELVDGGTLRDWVEAEPRRWRQAVELVIGVADGLAAAHSANILHRDIKPANVLVSKNGYAKIADFGLAKLADDDDRSHARSASHTAEGIVVGTVAYMSPEQAAGRPLDARSDIFSFGVLLYELLAGRHPFAGKTDLEVLQSLIHATPEPLGEDIPEALRTVVDKAVEKDPAERYQSMRDLVVDLKRIARKSSADKHPKASTDRSGDSPPSVRRSGLAGWLVALAALSILGAVVYLRPLRSELPETRLQVVVPSSESPTSFALAPDGRKVVFLATTDGKTQLWIRPFESESSVALPATEGAKQPFWSPDGRSIGFFAEGKLKRLDVAGGAPQILADAPTAVGGAWSVDGVILFGPSTTDPLYRVPANGGEPIAATALDTGDVSHRFPHFLPDGRHFLFYVAASDGGQSVRLGALGEESLQPLFEADSSAVFAWPDQLLFVRQGVLFAQRFDLETLRPSGDPAPVAENIILDDTFVGDAAISASAQGVLAYRRADDRRELLWFDRAGRQTGRLGAADSALRGSLRASPDGETIGITRSVSGNYDVWLAETSRDIVRRLTSHPARDGDPVWSPDGNRVAFWSRRTGPQNLYETAIQGGTETAIVESELNDFPTDWSPDGRHLLFVRESRATATDLWAVPMEGERTPFLVAGTAFDESEARFSPDGRWLTYQSNETGRTEIYVQPFPVANGKWLVSTDGGAQPQWSADGREIFYVAADHRLMAAPVALSPNPLGVQAGSPVTLFSVRADSEYSASADGQRFLVSSPLADVANAPITVVLSWASRH